MNNKQLGTEWENDAVKILADNGFWAHFITPDKRGAQPFDIIAVRDCIAFAVDCKTLHDKTDVFDIGRLEPNQITSFERWLACGNGDPIIAVKHKGEIFPVSYLELKKKGKVRLEKSDGEEGIVSNRRIGKGYKHDGACEEQS